MPGPISGNQPSVPKGRLSDNVPEVMSDPHPTPPADDVRMRGFGRRVRVEEALAWVDSHSSPLEAEPAPLGQLAGRVLAEEVVAPRDVPAFDRAAMDGYALQGAETTAAGPYNPLRFRVLGESLPGRPFNGTVVSGTAVRIMTGAPLPSGADAVLPAEYVREEADGQSIEILSGVAPWRHVGRRGEDIREGQTVLPTGRRLRPQDVGLIASLGISSVPVVRQPRVRILATGDELVPPGEPLPPHRIYDANSAMLEALVRRDGAVVESAERLPDRPEAIRAALERTGCEVILVSGGSSVGAEDHAPRLVAELGTLAVHGIAMRPSSPAGMGLVDDRLVFLLPGNPVSCLCAYDFFAGRAIRRLGGRSGAWPYPTQQVQLRRKIVSAVGRVDYCRVAIRDGLAEPIALSGASILSSTTQADGFVIVPADSEGSPPGNVVTVYLYDLPG